MLFVLPYGYSQTPTYIHFEPEIDIPFSTTYGEIIQDSLGYIWFGTDSGLYRYDGTDFEKIPTSSDLKDIEILNLKIDDQGTLWFTTIGGKLGYYSGREKALQSFSPNSYFDSLEVLSFKFQNDSIYLHSKSKNRNSFYLHGFSTKRRNNFRPQPIAYANKTFDFVFHQNNLFIPLGPINATNLFPTIYSIALIKTIPFSHFAYNDTTLLFYFNDKQIIFFNQKQVKSKKIVFDSTLVINNWYLKDNNVYFLTNNGYLKLNMKLQQISEAESPKGQDVFSMLKDREGGVWIGTNGNGIFYYPPVLISNYKKNHLLSSSRIQKIGQIKNGPYVIAADASIILLDKKTLSPLPFILNMRSKIIDFYTDDQQLIIGTNSEYLYKYVYDEEKHSLKYMEKHPFIGKKIVPLGSSKYIYGGYLFLDLYDSQACSFQNLGYDRVTSIYKDTATSSLWVGGIDKVDVWKYKSNDIIKHPKQIKGINDHVTMISKAPNNHIWLSTASNGLFEWHNDSIEHYPFIFNNKTRKINLINCATPSKIWFSSYNQIFFLDKDEKTISSPHPVNEVIKSPIVSLWNTNDSLLLGTKKGLYLYVPNTTLKQTNPFIKIESIKINNRDTVILHSYKLAHTKNNLEISFRSIGAFNPLNKPTLYFKLKQNEGWYPIKGNQILFSNLSPGNYHLSVKSVHNQNQTNYNTADIHFIIKKPFWRTIWFNSLVIFSSILLAFLWFSNKKQKIEIEKSREQESEKLKNAVLQLQMNPHFIFNSMNTIIYYITVANKEKSIQILTKMSRLIRQIFNFSHKNLIPLSMELQFLADYLDMEQERFAEKVKIFSKIDPRALDSSIPIPPLMVQPILENSFKHGLFHKKSGGILHFNVQIKDKKVIFIVEDNGVGRKKDKPLNKKTSSYDVIDSRIKLINESKGEFGNISTQFIIEDLFDENHNPIGTKSTLIFETKTKE